MAVAYLGLDRAEIAHASVLTRTAQQIGGSFGTAVLAVILESAVAAHHGDLVAAFHVAFWWSVGFAALAALLSFWLPGRPARPTPRAGRAPEPAGTQWDWGRRPVAAAHDAHQPVQAVGPGAPTAPMTGPWPGCIVMAWVPQGVTGAGGLQAVAVDGHGSDLAEGISVIGWAGVCG